MSYKKIKQHTATANNNFSKLYTFNLNYKIIISCKSYITCVRKTQFQWNKYI